MKVKIAQMSLILKNTIVVDTVSKEILDGYNVRIKDGVIVELSRDNFPSTGNTDVLDLSGKYLLPGLMDMHVHINPNLTSGPTLEKPIPERQTTRSVPDVTPRLHSYLYCGVTSVCDLGNIGEFIYGLRKLEREGKALSPRIFCAGSIVTAPGGHGSQFGTEIGDLPLDQQKLESHLANHPDLVKITYDEHNWGVRPLIPILEKRVLKGIIEYCHFKRFRVAVHISNELRAREAIYCGADVLAHPVIQSPITEEFAWLVASKKIPVISTLAIGERYFRLADNPEFVNKGFYADCLTEEEREKLYTEESERQRKNVWASWMRVMTPVAKRNIKLMHDQGAIITAGTDLSFGPDYLHELELLQDAGISPFDVIVCATRNAAMTLALDHKLGSVAKGKIADLIAVDEDPTRDVRNLNKLSTVIKNGVIINRKELDLPVNKSHKKQ